MNRHIFLPSMMGGLLLLGSYLSACSDDEPEPRTRAEFCADWADAACSDDTVTACQAASEDACRLSQEAYCLTIVPATFSDARGDDCLDAVEDAYEDADLTSTEIDTVRRLNGACGGIVTGTRAVGQTCDTNADCDRSSGAECVRRGGARGGTCQVPEPVGPGQACTEVAETCPSGFFCDGSNCIAALEVGATCQNDVQCEPAGYCSAGDVCVARLPLGSACTSDDVCESQFCYGAEEDERTCTELVRLSPAEDICADLR